MTTIKVTIDAATIQQFAHKLAELGSDKARRSLADALNKVGGKIRTEERRTLAQQTGIKVGRINMITHQATPGHLTWELITPGDESNLTDFGGRWGARGVSSAPWNTRRLFAGTWQMGKAGWRTFHRIGKERLPIKPAFGPNPARELLRDQARDVFERAPSQLAPQIEAQLRRWAP